MRDHLRTPATEDQEERHKIAHTMVASGLRAYEAGDITRDEFLDHIITVARWEYREALDLLGAS